MKERKQEYPFPLRFKGDTFEQLERFSKEHNFMISDFIAEAVKEKLEREGNPFRSKRRNFTRKGISND